MAGRTLAVNVRVGGVLHVAGSTPSAEVAAQITNPKVWEKQAEPVPAAREVDRPAKRAKK